MGPNAMTGILIRRGKFGHIDPHKEDGQEESEAKSGMRQNVRNAKDCSNHQEARRGKEGSSPRAHRGSAALLTL